MKQKIIYINSLPNFGGGEKHLLDLIRKMQREESFEIVVACPKGSPLARESSGLGVRTFPVPLKSKFDFKSIFILRDFLRRGKFHIVHTEDVRSNLLGTIAAVMARIPIIVWTVHLLSINRSIKEINPIKKRIWISVDRTLARYVDKIITISEFNRKELIEKERIEPEKIVVIPNSINLDEFNRRINVAKKKEEFRINNREKVVGFIGRLNHQKGLVYLLEAAMVVTQSVSNVRFLIIGDGPKRAEFEERTKELGIAGKVLFAGFRDDVNELYPIFDITVLPSLYEGLPIVPIESMGSGKPVVATQVAGTPEVVIDGETGVLVPPKDAESLAEAILQLLQDDALRRKMGKKGRELVKEKYSNERMVKAHKMLYQNLIESKGLIK